MSDFIIVTDLGDCPLVIRKSDIKSVCRGYEHSVSTEMVTLIQTETWLVPFAVQNTVGEVFRKLTE